jgi:hypothetical protein
VGGFCGFFADRGGAGGGGVCGGRTANGGIRGRGSGAPADERASGGFVAEMDGVRGAGAGGLEVTAGEGRGREARIASSVAASRTKSAAPRESRAESSATSRSRRTPRSSSA